MESISGNVRGEWLYFSLQRFLPTYVWLRATRSPYTPQGFPVQL